MSFDEFRQAIRGAAEPPAGLGLPLQALWHDARDDWSCAHACAQQAPGRDGAWVHAYLHRKEGDESNAACWYDRAGRSQPATALEAEWEAIARELLAQ